MTDEDWGLVIWGGIIALGVLAEHFHSGVLWGVTLTLMVGTLVYGFRTS